MRLELMGFEVHFRIKYNKFLLQALTVRAHEVVFPEVLLERIVVDIVLLLPASFSSVTDVAALMLVATMRVELIVSVEALSAESAFRVSLETTLINCAGVVVAKLLVFLEVCKGEELVLVSEHFLVSSTQIAKFS